MKRKIIYILLIILFVCGCSKQKDDVLPDRVKKEGKMSDYQDHYYPSEMAVDAQIQTFLMKKDSKAFLKKFDTDWVRYNRDIIRKVEDYEKSHND